MKYNYEWLKHLFFKPHEVERILTDSGIEMRGVIHVGAHYGLEYEDYLLCGIKNMIFFEPLKEVYKELLNRVGSDSRVKTYQMALGNKSGQIEMFVETVNKGQSSSILEPGTHLETYPNILFDNKEKVEIDKLDNIVFDRGLYNALNIDVQGYELEVLKGAVETLKTIDIIFCEVNLKEVYKGCAKLSDLDIFLINNGFIRVYEYLWLTIGYGDAIYIKR